MFQRLFRRHVASLAKCAGMIALAGSLFTSTIALGQFDSQNVSRHALVDLATLGAGEGNDCWGYVSPSGREYALMGVNDKLVVVEITTPASPVIVGSVSHSSSSWGDIKTYDTYAYVVNESGGGMDVVDLSDVDNGNVTLVQRVTQNGLSRSHNVAVNPDSGFLYIIGSNLNGGAVVVYSLVNPANPVEVGRWTQSTKAYHHDAHIVSYTSGPYAGKEILFGFSEGRGVDILDVTDKSNITLLSRTPYPGVQYCHQGWTSPDLKYLYIGDELDEGATTNNTRTMIYDISDLSAPQHVATFTNATISRDHNQYVRGCTLFQANYTTGLRILNLSNPLAPVEIGYYDTYPESNGRSYNGAWSVYPLFPSGTVIISDINRGLFILDVSAAESVGAAMSGVSFVYPQALPQLANPLGGDTVSVDVTGACGGIPTPGTGIFYYNTGAGWSSVAMQESVPNSYVATLPAAVCTQEVAYYFSAQRNDGVVFTDPPDAPTSTYTYTSASQFADVLVDDFETNLGWTTGPDTASTGTWVRVDPVGTPESQVEDDHSPVGTLCLVTAQNSGGVEGLHDVDGGLVVITSPMFDLSSGDAFVEYYRSYHERDVGDDAADGFLAEISNNDGASWVTIETLDTGNRGWQKVQFLTSDLLAPTSQMRLRFTATDGPADPDVVEAAIDDVRVFSPACDSQPADISGDGATDLRDFAMLQECFTGAGACPCTPAMYGDFQTSPCRAADLDLDGDVDLNDYAAYETVLMGP